MMRPEKMIKTFYLSAIISLTTASIVACSTDKIKNTKSISISVGSRTQAKSPDPVATATSTPNNSENATGQTPTPEVPQSNLLEIGSNGAEAPQRKNFLQLQRAYSNCLGAPTATPDQPDLTLLVLKEDMIMRTYEDLPTSQQDPSKAPPEPKDLDQTLPEGRIRFFTKDYKQAAVGKKNILDVEREFLETTATRTTTYSDSLEDEIFLKSLLTVANVAAFNCDVSSTTSTCYCANSTAAAVLLQRCLPQYSPESIEFKQAVASLSSAENCGSNNLLDRRRAIASLLSSYAFATAK